MPISIPLSFGIRALRRGVVFHISAKSTSLLTSATPRLSAEKTTSPRRDNARTCAGTCALSGVASSTRTLLRRWQRVQLAAHYPSCFADNYLFVLFDGGGSSGQKDEIHIFSIDADGNGLTHAGACALPVIEGIWTEQTDFEGLTIDGTNLYLSVDARDSTKLVYRYSDYSISKFV